MSLVSILGLLENSLSQEEATVFTPSSLSSISISTPKTPTKKRKENPALENLSQSICSGDSSLKKLEPKPFFKFIKLISSSSSSPIQEDGSATPKTPLKDISQATKNILSPKRNEASSSRQDLPSLAYSSLLSLKVKKTFFESFESVDPQIFFSDEEPNHWYSFYKNKNDEVALNIPLKLGKLKRVIYVIRNKNNNKWLIGKTASTLMSRLSQYLEVFSSGFSFNLPLYAKEIMTDPSSFEFGVLYVVKPTDDLIYFEKGFIKFKGKIHQLYNKNEGGGGGTSREEEIVQPYYFQDPTTITPEKRYGISLKDKKLSLDLTPGYHQKYQELLNQKHFCQSFLYSIKDEETGEEYIGTTGDVTTRLRGHISKSNKLWKNLKTIPTFENVWKNTFEKDKVKNRLRFLIEMRSRFKKIYERHKADNPFYNTSSLINMVIVSRFRQIKLGFFPIYFNDPKNVLSPKSYSSIQKANTIGSAERIFIQARKTLQPNGFNLHSGGNGPIKEQRRRPRHPDFTKFPSPISLGNESVIG